MAGLSLYTEGDTAMVARENFEDAVRNFVLAAFGLGLLALLLWVAGAFDRHYGLLVVVVAAVVVAQGAPFVTVSREIRFDREARKLSVVTTSRSSQRQKVIPFSKVVEVRAVPYRSRTADGYHIEVQLESYGRIRLNAQPADEAIALRWVEQLHQFLGGRVTGDKVEAFAPPR